MKVEIFVKGNKEPIVYNADRIDVLDIEMEGVKYKQIRYFRKGFSKSDFIEEAGIVKIRSAEA
jgi:hypothetical protein